MTDEGRTDYLAMEKEDLIDMIYDLKERILVLNDYLVDVRFIIADLKVWDEEIREKDE
jgi:hypothetical protein